MLTSYIILALLCFVLAILIFWLYSNIWSIRLGAPAISSPKHELWREFADPQKTILDLGSGNGSFCLRVAPHFKQVYGIESSPFYYIVSKWRTRGKNNVTIYYRDFLVDEWPKADLIYCYLLPPVLGKIRDRLKQLAVPVISYAFLVPEWSYDRLVQRPGQQLAVYNSTKPTLKAHKN